MDDIEKWVDRNSRQPVVWTNFYTPLLSSWRLFFYPLVFPFVLSFYLLGNIFKKNSYARHCATHCSYRNRYSSFQNIYRPAGEKKIHNHKPEWCIHSCLTKWTAEINLVSQIEFLVGRDYNDQLTRMFSFPW